MSKSILLLAIPAFICIFACNRNCDDNVISKSEAVLHWNGEYEVDGCGYFIFINDHQYKPENESIIDSSFKHPETNVIVEYKLLDKPIERPCGFKPPVPIGGIKLISIQKR